MTEEEWLSCSDPQAMLEFLRDRGASDRKFRLFAVACCRSLWHLLDDDRCRRAVERSESYADGVLAKSVLAISRKEMPSKYRNKHRQAIARSLSERSAEGWALGWDMSKYSLRANSSDAANLTLLAYVVGQSHSVNPDGHDGFPAQVLRDLFGNPFRQVTIDPSWLASTVTALARGIYDERAFDRLPILADALTDAGCDSDLLLDHLRGPGPHVRGCWALDLVLGKT